MRIMLVLGLLVYGEEAAVHSLLQLKDGLQGLQRGRPLRRARFSNVLEKVFIF
jgi:hypothetical protein